MAPTKNVVKRSAVKSAVRPCQHPSLGNGYAYSHDFRPFVQYLRRNNWHNHPIIHSAQKIYLFPFKHTVKHHWFRLIHRGHLRETGQQSCNCFTWH